MDHRFSKADVAIVGAGACGIACAIELQDAGLRVEIIEKGCIANSIYHFPDNMVFFSDARALEIGGAGMHCRDIRPTRREALRYYRQVCAFSRITVRQQETLLRIDGADGDFLLRTNRGIHRAAKVVIATGYFGQPNMLGIPGELLPKVHHYYRDAHPYYGSDVAVIGGRNSAGIAASELARAGARVTVIHRRERFNMKPAIASEMTALMLEGGFRVVFNAVVEEIRPDRIAVRTRDARMELRNDAVFAMTGYRPDLSMLKRNGIGLTAGGARPLINESTLESTRPGIYLAGTVVAGLATSEVSIENGRSHGAKIAAAIANHKARLVRAG